jgi:hypothetical protein
MKVTTTARLNLATLMTRTLVEERFWQKVDKDGPGGCWLWRGAKQHGGYGHIRTGQRNVRAHRFSYEMLVGPIPKGLVIDHLCRVHNCVNPRHLEPVTQAENVRRGATVSSAFAAKRAARTHCPNGHPASDYFRSSDGRYRCRACGRDAARRRYYQKRGRAA